jgi:hypothetical protein
MHLGAQAEEIVAKYREGGEQMDAETRAHLEQRIAKRNTLVRQRLDLIARIEEMEREIKEIDAEIV